MDYIERIKQLEIALAPLAAIADEYDADGLDECRPSWVKQGSQPFNSSTEIYSGRGGKELLTLNDALHARDVLLGKVIPRPEVDPVVTQAIKLYEAGMPNLPWNQMPEDRRQGIIANYRKLGLLR